MTRMTLMAGLFPASCFPMARRLPLAALVLVGLLAAACRTAPAAAPDERSFAQKLDEVLHRESGGGAGGESGGGAIVSARVIDPETGAELYATDNTHVPLKPASNMKLIASATALHRLGADHVFTTYLALDGDDLWLIGTGDGATGDPTLEKRRGRTPVSVLDDFADALLARGVTEVPGDLVYDETAFERHRVHPSWWPSDLLNWYAAPVSGLNFNDNCIDVTVIPDVAGEPARYEVMPPTQMVKIINETVTGREGEPSIRKLPGEPTYIIAGGVTERAELSSKPVDEPGRFFADALRTRLAERGIAVRGELRAADGPLGGDRTPPGEAIVAVHHSAMPEVLGRVNKQSQNMLAEAVLKAAGRDLYPDRPGSWLSGYRAALALLEEAGIDGHQLVLVDGSGLSHLNRVTTHMISELLRFMHHHEHAEVFYQSLAIGGVEGTIARRLKAIEGKVHAKTGYISGVRALSGYVDTAGGQRVIFSFLYNKIPGSVRPIEALQDEALELIHAEGDAALEAARAKVAATTVVEAAGSTTAAAGR